MRHFLALVLTLCAACGASAPSPDFSDAGSDGGDGAADGPRCPLGYAFVNAHCTPASDIACGDTRAVCRAPQVCALVGAGDGSSLIRCEAP